jgi:putative FmdB family regulatory protein
VPIYEYRCRNGHTFEVMQSMSDEPIVTCQECRSSVERVFHPVAVHFKGSGFYTTDYGRMRGHGSDSGSGTNSKSKETASAKSEGGGESKSEGSSESKSESKSSE